MSTRGKEWRPEVLYGLLVALLTLSVLRPLHVVLVKTGLVPAFFWVQNSQQLPFLFYGKLALFNFLLLAVLVAQRARVHRLLGRAAAWLNQEEHHAARQTVFAFVSMIVFTFLFKVHLGFWHRGPQGWTYQHAESGITASYDLPGATTEFPEYLLKAVKEGNVRYLERRGYLKGNALILHYSGGVALPANLELTDMSMAGKLYHLQRGMTPEDARFFISILKSSLEERRAGREFLLPRKIAFPNHITYQYIDYSSYPSSVLLKRVSYWELVVRVEPPGKLSLVGAKLLTKIAAQ